MLKAKINLVKFRFEFGSRLDLLDKFIIFCFICSRIDPELLAGDCRATTLLATTALWELFIWLDGDCRATALW